MRRRPPKPNGRLSRALREDSTPSGREGGVNHGQDVLVMVALGGGEPGLDEAHELGDVGRNAVVVLVAKRERAAALP